MTKNSFLLLISLPFFITACSNDPLGIGSSPELPSDKQALAGQPGERPETFIPDIIPDTGTFSGSNSTTKIRGLYPPLNPLPAGVSFIPVMITSTWGVGAQVTVWALAENNWLWGYSAADSASFGKATQWYAARQKDGTVVFVNALPKGSQGYGTCMEPYSNGVVHTACRVNTPKPSQRWKLIPVNNGSMLIVNANNNKCLRLADKNTAYAWNVTLESCNSQPGKEIDKSFIWNLTPWPVFASVRG